MFLILQTEKIKMSKQLFGKRRKVGKTSCRSLREFSAREDNDSTRLLEGFEKMRPKIALDQKEKLRTHFVPPPFDNPCQIQRQIGKGTRLGQGAPGFSLSSFRDGR